MKTTRTTSEAPTALSRLRGMAADAEAAFNELLDHSSVRYYDKNAGSWVHQLDWNPHRWVELAPDALRYVGRASDAMERFSELGGRAVRASMPARYRRFMKPTRVLKRVVNQGDGAASGVPGNSIDGARSAVARALREQLDIIERLPSAHGNGGRLLVPDTNALIFKPELEQWTPREGEWTIVVMPQVVGELDDLKMRERTKERATKVIRRLKEYGRRGNTLEGVRVAPGVMLQEVAVEADMDAAPSWLKAGHRDDELLASILELQWRDLTASVELGTRDRNMQNKARFAEVPYVDVEDDIA